ncbi:MAG TPA: HEAT repeat domain-containing protein [Polyangiaceae bacterium]|nr:HEAT repeat domain-containing protein [Polyangiaceae bacterium]
MRFQATAKSSERSNAAGAVELECGEGGLLLGYRGVFALSEGYVPGALATGADLNVPWAQVWQTSLEGDELFLEVDSSITPLNRLCLTAFTTGVEVLPPEETRRRQLVVRVASGGLAFTAALAAFAGARGAGAAPSLSLAISAAVLTALAVLAVGFWADRFVATPVPRVSGDVARELFLAELALRHPALTRAPAPPAPPRPPLVFYFERLLPRTTAAIVITLSAALLGTLLTTRVIVLDEGGRAPVAARRASEDDSFEAPPPRRPAPPAAAPADSISKPAAAEAPPAGDAVRLGEACRCVRSDSALWKQPIPRLSLLVLSQRVRKGRGEDENKRKKYLELDLGVVNNGKTDVPEVSLLVEFFERDPPPSNKRYSVSTRPLFYEGPLRPAQAIKWSVEGQGVEFEIHNPVPGDVGPFGDDAAPANLFAELLTANHRPVRLHAAMMLTFLGDPRARDAVLELREALREDEAPYLNRLIAAQAPVKVCKLEIEPARQAGSACLFNAANDARKDLGLKVRALADEVSHGDPVGQPPEVRAESSYHVPGQLPPNEGRVASFSFDLRGERAEAFEAFSDRYDLLP